MWRYYKCVNLVRVLIQGSKVILFVTWKCLARAAVQAGLRPVPTLWLDQPPVGDVQKNGQFKTTRECARSLSWRSLSWTWLDSLELCGTPRSYASRFRNCALQRAPVRWTLTSEPTIGRSLTPASHCKRKQGVSSAYFFRQCVAGAEQERQCLFLLRCLRSIKVTGHYLWSTQKKNIFKVCKWDVMYFKQLPWSSTIS